MNDYTVQNPILKAASAFILGLFGSWSEAAAFIATLYTLLLIGEWTFKKFLAIRSWYKKRGLNDETA